MPVETHGQDQAVIRVTGGGHPRAIAESIYQALSRTRACDVVAVGPAATTTVVTAIAIADGLLASHMYGLSCRIYLVTLPGQDGGHPISGRLFRLTRVSHQAVRAWGGRHESSR